MNILKRFFLVSLLAAISTGAEATIRMPVIFQSNMVLQRDKETVIWGFGDAGERVTVHFINHQAEAIADVNGQWLVRMPAQKAGGPFDLIIRGATNVIELKNILFGDVWICGGQSNMQYPIDQIGYVPPDTLAIAHSNIRLFTASIGMDYVPCKDLAGGMWKQATAATIRQFSATAYFFGKFLCDTLKVPIGLISDNLGATSIETWMSREVLQRFPQFGEYCKQYLDPAKSVKQVDSTFKKTNQDWQINHYLKGQGLEERWYLPETDTAGWKPMEIPSWWEEKGMQDFDGVVWFRKEFDLPENFSGDTLSLPLNQIDDYDITWVNGQKVGEGYGNQTWRRYNVPASILKPKNNTLVVRVFDAGGRGGMYTHSIWWDQNLVGNWLFKADYKIDAATFPRPLVVNMSPFATPGVLYNANIAPITSLALKGVIWYQGESNVSRAVEYRELLPAMIGDWRAKFGQGDLPFIFVQLANYMQDAAEPAEYRWAELREAQSAALKLSNTGMAVTIDIGDAYNIHPRNKMDVGKRLGLAALQAAYGQEVAFRGPTFESAEWQPGQVILHFKKESGPLITRDKYGYIRGFAIAGPDRKFYWAKASILDGNVQVTAESVKEPVGVRYAWSDNPGNLDLYNPAGLPAAPFRTDEWPLSTAGYVFSENPWENN